MLLHNTEAYVGTAVGEHTTQQGLGLHGAADTHMLPLARQHKQPRPRRAALLIDQPVNLIKHKRVASVWRTLRRAAHDVSARVVFRLARNAAY